MAWIESHQELRSHRKTLKLKRLLNVSLPETIGILHMVWWWALDQASDGDLSKLSEEVNDAVGFDGLSIFGAMTEAGFIDEDGKLHDWRNYAGRLLDIRAKDAQRKKDFRTKSNGRPPDVQKTLKGVPALLRKTSNEVPAGRLLDGAKTAHVDSNRDLNQQITTGPNAAPAPKSAEKKTATTATSSNPLSQFAMALRREQSISDKDIGRLLAWFHKKHPHSNSDGCAHVLAKYLEGYARNANDPVAYTISWGDLPIDSPDRKKRWPKDDFIRAGHKKLAEACGMEKANPSHAEWFKTLLSQIGGAA